MVPLFRKGGSKTCGKTGAAAAHAASTQLLRMLRMLRQHECCDCCVSCVKPATDIAHQKTRQLNNSNSSKTQYNNKQVPTETTGARPILHGTGTRKRHSTVYNPDPITKNYYYVVHASSNPRECKYFKGLRSRYRAYPNFNSSLRGRGNTSVHAMQSG